MKINIQKNQTALIEGSDSGLGYIVGLQWEDSGRAMDLDLEVFLLGQDGKVTSEDDIVFYGTKPDKNGMLPNKSGSVIHHGDRRDGQIEGDDEQVDVYFAKIPQNIKKLAITVTIAGSNSISFGKVRNTVVHIYKMKKDGDLSVPGEELIRYELSDEFPNENAIIFGEIVRNPNGSWNFNASGIGVIGGLEALCYYYGFNEVDA